MHIGIGLSTEKDPVRAAKEAIILARDSIQKSKIDLAILFSTTDYSSDELLKAISNSLQEIPIIGSSGAVVISNQGVHKSGVVLVLLGLSEGTNVNVATVKNIKELSGLKAGEELGEKLLNKFYSHRNLSIILSDALIEESSNLIFGIQSKLGKSFPLFGGSTSDNLDFLKTNLFFNRERFNDGCIGLLWGGKLNFGMGIKHGWKPLGKTHTVTLSNGNIVKLIDGKPAVRLYEEYLGCHLSKLKKGLKHISILYPIGIYLPGEEYLLRNILSVDEEGGLRFQGNVPQNSLIRLMISTKENCLEATKLAVDEAKKGMPKLVTADTKKSSEKNLVLVFSSISRYLLLKRDAHKELEIIKSSFAPDTPIIGLYTYGELAPLTAINYLGQVYLHNQTIGILCIGG